MAMTGYIEKRRNTAWQKGKDRDKTRNWFRKKERFYVYIKQAKYRLSRLGCRHRVYWIQKQRLILNGYFRVRKPWDTHLARVVVPLGKSSTILTAMISIFDRRHLLSWLRKWFPLTSVLKPSVGWVIQNCISPTRLFLNFFSAFFLEAIIWPIFPQLMRLKYMLSPSSRPTQTPSSILLRWHTYASLPSAFILRSLTAARSELW